MKKALIIILAILIAAAAGGGGFFFGRSTVTPARAFIFVEIVETEKWENGTHFLVYDHETDGEDIFVTDENTKITWRGEDISADSLNAGDRVAVFFSGKILLSYPGRIQEVYAVRLIEKAEEGA